MMFEGDQSQVDSTTILLLESPCPFVRSSVTFFTPSDVLDASGVSNASNVSNMSNASVRRGLSARRARRTKSSRLEGPPNF